MINSKFQNLSDYLKLNCSNSIQLSFKEIESILGFELCESARKYRVYWNKSKTHMLPLLCFEAGFDVDFVDMQREYVRF